MKDARRTLALVTALALGLPLLEPRSVHAGWKSGLLSGGGSSSRRAAKAAPKTAVNGEAGTPHAGMGAADELARIAIAAELLALYLDGATTAALSPDGSAVAIGTARGPVRVHDAANGKVLRKLGGHWHSVSAVAVDDRHVVSGSSYGTVRVWRRKDGTQLASFGRTLAMLPWSDAPVGEVAVAQDGRWLALSGTRHGTRFADLLKGGGQSVLGPATNPGAVASSPPRAARIAFVSSTVLALAQDGAETPRIVDLSGTLDATFASAARGSAGEDRLVSLAASPDGKLLATGTASGSVVLWDVAKRSEIRRWRAGSSPVEALTFTRQSQFIVGVAGDGAVVAIPADRSEPSATRPFAALSGFRALDVRVIAKDAVRVLFEGSGKLYVADVKPSTSLEELEEL